MKTPDEIKKGLECCLTGNCTDCPYRKLYGVFRCKTERTRDAIGYIRKLEIAMSASPIVHTVDLNDDAVKYIQQLEAERDAALADFKLYLKRNIKGECGVYACDLCKHGGRYEDWDEIKCPTGCTGVSHWQWRGAQKEETK